MSARWTIAAAAVGSWVSIAGCAGGDETASTAGGAAGTGGAHSTSSAGAGAGGATTSTGTSLCGNGVIDPGEECDGANFGGATCQSLGLESGQLACNASCAIVAGGCQPKEQCTNGQDDDGNGLIDCQDPDCFGNAACLDSCTPYTAAAAPGVNSGDNTGRPNVHHASCSTAMDGNEQMFQFTAPADGTIVITLDPILAASFSLSVRSACGDDSSEIACSNKTDLDNFYHVTLPLSVKAGRVYYVMVEGMTTADEGPFDLDLEFPVPENICDDLFDNDGDGYVDCDDTTCQTMPACTPGATATGGSCAANHECTANHDDPICLGAGHFPGGYCSEFCDVVAQDCAANAICYGGLAISKNGVCLQACAVDTDCRIAEGYACVDIGLARKVCQIGLETQCDDYLDNDMDGLYDCNDPTSCQALPACAPGTSAVGQPCTMHNQCFANQNNPLCMDQAHIGYPGGYCTHFCDPASPDCGPGAICVNNGPNGEDICMQTCTSTAQCRSGYACQNLGFTKMVCF